MKIQCKATVKKDSLKRADRITADVENRHWIRDINSYYRWKVIHDKHGSEFAKEMMEKINSRWPTHAKAFE